MHPLESYLKSLNSIRLSGQAVPETSYYPAIAELLNELGKSLDPKVSCVINLQNTGAGIPDAGLFTADQLKAQKRKKAAPNEDGPPPGRGVLEIKGTGTDAFKTADGEQVRKYLKRYGQVLVTNYRDFLLVTRGEDGELELGERYRLADGEKAFWKAAARPQVMTAAHGVRFLEYIKRVMLHRAQIADPKDLAWFLASYARDALARIELDADQPGLSSIRKALEEALGINFTGEKGEHFFRSTLVQTLFYGLFSAWVLWSRQHQHSDRKARFHWKEAAWTLHVPAIKVLFEQLATPSKLGQLDLVEVLEWSEEALNRVDRAAFFKTFEQAQAVQYFYEPFLEAFDPELRKELGVWYTPHEVVQYMVARVDTVLREELKIADGLADPRVYVLDPCCGTGAYLVEVLRVIGRTLTEKGGDALLGHDLKKAATERVFGFEILPAPFVVSHLQLGLLLQQAGAPIDAASEERVGVYLTNALTGWEPPEGAKQHLMWQELEAERDAADRVKQQSPILVILGNPPYNGFAGLAVDEERNLVEAYRKTTLAPKPQGQGLNDLYVRFFRMAERKIVDGTGQGVVCFISSYSWLNGQSFTGMREHFLGVFDKIWIDNLHGDRKISEYAPDGGTSETVFAMRGQSTGIQVGTAIALLCRQRTESRIVRGDATLQYRDFAQASAEERRGALLASLDKHHAVDSYTSLQPEPAIGLPIKPAMFGPRYLSWPKLPDLFPHWFSGIKSARDDFLVDIDRKTLEERIASYFDKEVTDEEMRILAPVAMRDTDRFPASSIRQQLRARGIDKSAITKYCYRPFDHRWLYWEKVTKLLDERRAEYFPHLFEGNHWMSAVQRPRRGHDGPLAATLPCSYHINELSARLIPVFVKYADHHDLFGASGPNANLTDTAKAYLAPRATALESPFFHCIAVLHSPRFAVENAGALRQDWPRVPLPAKADLLKTSSALGQQLATLLDPETPAPGVNAGTIRADLKLIGPIARQDGKGINAKAGDLEITAGWGHAGKGGVTMPARGKLIERDYSKTERAAMDQAEVEAKAWPGLLGETTCDIFLNDTAYWANIPKRVWEYTLGGYQVIKKWLSYRELELLGRALTVEEARYVTEMARRITAILLLGPALDANYEAVKRETWVWPGGGK